MSIFRLSHARRTQVLVSLAVAIRLGCSIRIRVANASFVNELLISINRYLDARATKTMQTWKRFPRQVCLSLFGGKLATLVSTGYPLAVRKLVHRPRRLRRSPALRNLVRETQLSAHDFILPLFISEKIDKRRPIPSMPGVFQLPVTEVSDEARHAQDLGLQAILLFGIPAKKDEQASGAYAENGVIQEALRAIKSKCPELVTITDVCLCEYMSHGHCGVTRVDGDHFNVLNDETVGLLVKTALSHAAAGADMVAPSDMMDGRIGAIREALDASGFDETGIMSYAAKFASVFYGPFREAAESPPQFGDRRSYQMDCANAKEALREVALDIDEGADIVMVKPAMPYIDILWRVRERFGKPTAVYHVSGEYAMVKAAAEKGILDERAAVLEITTALKRAGADIVVTYWARELAKWCGKYSCN
jgi:porphobilinogen synthase